MEKKQELEYLQWLQKNAKNYMMAFILLIVLISVSLCLFFSNPLDPKMKSSMVLPGNDVQNEEQTERENLTGESAETLPETVGGVAETPLSKEVQKMLQQEQQEQTQTTEPQAVVAEPQKIQQAEETKTQEADKSQKTTQEPTEPAETKKETTEADKPTTVDVQQIAKDRLPCEGVLQYSYGIGYDAQYQDYRFHEEYCYQMKNPAVYAVAAGLVQEIRKEDGWTVIVQTDTYHISYRGLRECAVRVGETLAAGQTIGACDTYLYIKAEKQSEG